MSGRSIGQLAEHTVLGLALASALAVPSRAAPAEVTLGTRERCARYDGLPVGFGEHPHAGMVRIAGGSFVPGSRQGYPEERPAGAVHVDTFWIDRTEVTIAQYQAFVRATGYRTEAEETGAGAVFRVPGESALRAYAWWEHVAGASYLHPAGPGSDVTGRASHPAVQLTYRDALAYARWLGRRLPTEHEWEYAARAGADDESLHGGPRDPEGRPTANFWQGAFPHENTAEDGFSTDAPVGCFGANALGLYDMIGNVWEWTQSPFAPHGADMSSIRDKTSLPRVIKGGSFLCAPSFCTRYRVSARHAHEADMPTMHLGFRTVLDDGP